MPEVKEAKSLAARLVGVMGDVTNLEKDGQMQGGGNYRYLSEEKVVSALHAAFVKHGIVIAPTAMEVLGNRESKTGSGNTMITSRILVTYTLMNPDDPKDVIVGQALGEGSDIGDKVLNKCMTAAYKYFLRETCMISTGDDPDHEASQESRPTPVAAKPVSAKQSAEAGHQYKCDDCGKVVTDSTTSKGQLFTATKKAESSQKEFHLNLCFGCVKNRREAVAAEPAQGPTDGTLGLERDPFENE
jgi:hypothetical protein